MAIVGIRREDTMETGSAWIRDMEIPPSEYYPEGYHPKLLKEWPLKKDFLVPIPETMQDPKYKK